MRIKKCSWCGRIIQVPKLVEDELINHGMCQQCYQKMMAELPADPLLAALEEVEEEEK